MLTDIETGEVEKNYKLGEQFFDAKFFKHHF